MQVQRCAQSRMSGKRQLFLHRKYADPLPLVCFNLWLARQDEGCFREMHLASESLHVLVGQTARVGENGERIAGERCLRKNIELNEFVSAGHIFDPISQLLTLTSQLF